MSNLPPYEGGPHNPGPGRYDFGFPPYHPAFSGPKRGTRYYLDTEFIDDGKTIDLISIGIVSEDGREYYAQSRDYNPHKITEWLQDNVIAHLHRCPNGIWDPVRCIQENNGEYRTINLSCPYRTHKEIRDEVIAFLDPAQYGKPEIYGWCSGYDFVTFCQLWGTMMQLPDGFPHYMRDLQQVLDELAIKDDALPRQAHGLHNALEDARHIKLLWDRVNTFFRH